MSEEASAKDLHKRHTTKKHSTRQNITMCGEKRRTKNSFIGLVPPTYRSEEAPQETYTKGLPTQEHTPRQNIIMCREKRRTKETCTSLSRVFVSLCRYGVPTISRLLNIIGLFCRIASLS